MLWNVFFRKKENNAQEINKNIRLKNESDGISLNVDEQEPINVETVCEASPPTENVQSKRNFVKLLKIHNRKIKKIKEKQ